MDQLLNQSSMNMSGLNNIIVVPPVEHHRLSDGQYLELNVLTEAVEESGPDVHNSNSNQLTGV
jgi:hypothetical protein